MIAAILRFMLHRTKKFWRYDLETQIWLSRGGSKHNDTMETK
jgi:hypothetical protein